MSATGVPCAGAGRRRGKVGCGVTLTGQRRRLGSDSDVPGQADLRHPRHSCHHLPHPRLSAQWPPSAPTRVSRHTARASRELRLRLISARVGGSAHAPASLPAAPCFGFLSGGPDCLLGVKYPCWSTCDSVASRNRLSPFSKNESYFRV
uniref:Uncharacterized protein n=1 Tax=Molossus molossus TaxID=27622 RepID=A0A7J8GKZ6_MOLMO|nr:hypothetical protein HJG59_011539 [Molossus molossus]